MCIRDRAIHDGQTEPAAALPEAGGEERIENLWQGIGCYAPSIVADADLYVSVRQGLGADPDFPRCIFGEGVDARVLEQVQEDLTQRPRIRVELDRRRDIDQKLGHRGADASPESLYAFLDNIDQSETPAAIAGLVDRDFLEVGDELRCTLEVADQHDEAIFAIGKILVEAGLPQRTEFQVSRQGLEL